MTRISRRDLIEVFHARFSETRSLADAVDAVATEIEARCEMSVEVRVRHAEARLERLREELEETGAGVRLRLRTEQPRRTRQAPVKRRDRDSRAWAANACVSSGEILASVARAHGLSVKDILSGDRHAEPSLARHVSMWLHREIGRVSDETIAKLHRLDNHTTAIAARRKIQALVDGDPAYGERLRALVGGARAGDEQRAA